MYHEEKMINGVMHWRTDPDKEFQPYDIKELSRRYLEAQKDAMNSDACGHCICKCGSCVYCG